MNLFQAGLHADMMARMAEQTEAVVDMMGERIRSADARASSLGHALAAERSARASDAAGHRAALARAEAALASERAAAARAKDWARRVLAVAVAEREGLHASLTILVDALWETVPGHAAFAQAGLFPDGEPMLAFHAESRKREAEALAAFGLGPDHGVPSVPPPLRPDCHGGGSAG